MGDGMPEMKNQESKVVACCKYMMRVEGHRSTSRKEERVSNPPSFALYTLLLSRLLSDLKSND